MHPIKYGVKFIDPSREQPDEWCECWYKEYAPINIKKEYATYDINAAHNYREYLYRNNIDFNYQVEEKP